MFGLERRAKDALLDAEGNFAPKPVDTSELPWDIKLNQFVEKYSEQLHELWAQQRLAAGWGYSENYNDVERVHPLLKTYKVFTEKQKDVYRIGVREAIRALQAWGWQVEKTKDAIVAEERIADHRNNNMMRPGRRFSDNDDIEMEGRGHQGYLPKPFDLSSIALSRELNTVGEMLAENFHNIWARRKKIELDEKGGQHPLCVPYDTLTAIEKERYRGKAYELLRFMQYGGYRLVKREKDNIDHKSSQEKRFSYMRKLRIWKISKKTETSDFG